MIDDGAGNTTAVKVLSVDPQNDYLITLEALPALPGWVGVPNAARGRAGRSARPSAKRWRTAEWR